MYIYSSSICVEKNMVTVWGRGILSDISSAESCIESGVI